MPTAHHPKPKKPQPRAGFTLVELLMVIVILAMLIALVSAAVFSALTTGKNAKILMEINSLHTAVESSSGGMGYPPSFAITNAASQGQVMRYLSKQFQYSYPYTAPSPQRSFRGDVLTATTGVRPGGCDVDDLDQAEALVFWLGGLPSTTTETKLIGFSRDPRNPFQDDTVQPQRTDRKFEFDSSRLVDRDNDGWWEYVPDATATSGEMAPYVYFDSNAYKNFPVTSYPAPAAPGPAKGPATQIASWGTCAPYQRAAGPPIQWMNSDKFQIICAGLDGVYSDNATYDALVFPDEVADTNDDGSSNLDNLANFYPDGPFSDAKE